MDFTSSLDEVRYKVLNAFICNHCRNVLTQDGLPHLPNELVHVLSKQWFGKTSDPNSPANIASKLGYDLFTMQGLEATPWEKFLSIIQEDGLKQLITVIGTIVGAVLAGILLFRLGIKQ